MDLYYFKGFPRAEGNSAQRLPCTSAYLLQRPQLTFQIFQSQERETRDFGMPAEHRNETASPALTEVRRGLRKCWGTPLTGDGVRWGRRRGSGSVGQEETPESS